MIFKVLPVVKIAWRYVCIGAIITALLFYFGKLLLGLCLGRSSVTFAHGAAGSMVIVLLWVYFSGRFCSLVRSTPRFTLTGMVCGFSRCRARKQ